MAASQGASLPPLLTAVRAGRLVSLPGGRYVHSSSRPKGHSPAHPSSLSARHTGSLTVPDTPSPSCLGLCWSCCLSGTSLSFKSQPVLPQLPLSPLFFFFYQNTCFPLIFLPALTAIRNHSICQLSYVCCLSSPLQGQLEEGGHPRCLIHGKPQSSQCLVRSRCPVSGRQRPGSLPKSPSR